MMKCAQTDQQVNLIWIDGKYTVSREAKIGALSQTFQYGFGVYEGLRSYQTERGVAIFRLQDHTDRLFNSANILNLNIPYKKDELNNIQCEILRKSHLKNAYLRPVVFLGDEFLGLHTQSTSVHVMIAAVNWENVYISKEQFRQGISLKTSSYERLSTNGLNKAKANGLYLISILANNEARASGCDEALMLDRNGYVAEGSGANLFMVKNNCLYTPDLTFALDGITRKTVFKIAAEQNIMLIEKRITQEELYQADEVFFTGTAAEILPITTIDNKKIATGSVGQITKKIQQLFF